MSLATMRLAKRISKLLSGMLFGLVIVWSAVASAGNLGFKTSWKYYNITGSTAKELKKNMKLKGPNGYWAYARWYVNWSGNCQVDVTINYTMPRWQNRTSVPKKLQNSWDKMIANLKIHEEVHGSHGIKAANAIVASKCQNAYEIMGK